MVTPDAKLDAAAHAWEQHGLSERRACQLVGIARWVARYVPTQPDDAELRSRLRLLAGERRRFGYLRQGYLLERERDRAQPQEAAEDLPAGRVEGQAA
jgi:putative transposase